MNTNCSHCGTANAEANKFCQQCGRPLATDAAPSPFTAGESTIRWTGRPIQAKGGMSRAVPVDVLFGNKSKLVLGRAADCDLSLPHPSVSRYHAIVERTPDGIRLRDLNSVNGVLVGGRRISEPVLVQERERIGIGPYLFSLADGVLYSLDSSLSVRLEACQLEKVVRLANGQERKLLDNINLAVEPGEFVSLLGPSGSGKSTLMDCLNGRRPATGGRVLANGEDFYRHFDSFRQSLGYVPQRDIVHTQLTVYRALYYTAQLRLPKDTESSELQSRVEDVIKIMELDTQRHTLIANLSGGQIKRVSLGAELLARPCLLYIDEATSGLDAGTEARMMRLFRQLADEGKSVICITHNVDNVNRCNLVLLLCRGKLVYFGPPQEAPPYFGVDRLGDVYDRLSEKEPESWEKEFAASSLHKEFVRERTSTSPEDGLGAANGAKPGLGMPLAALRSMLPSIPGLRKQAEQPEKRRRPYRPPLWHQFRILTLRYAELIWGDRRSLRLLFLQAPIVALVVLLGFAGRPYQDLVPIPREMHEHERKAIQAIESLLHGRRVSPELLATHREALEQIRMPLREGQGTVNAYEVLLGLHKLDEGGVLQKLLDAKGPVLPGEPIVNPRYTYMLLFILAVTVLWFGCNNAAKEIVKEEAIYGRERAVNLGILPYLGSKFLILGVMSALQVFLLMFVIYGGLAFLHWLHGDAMPASEYMLAYLPQYAVLVLLALTGVALGLLLSACVSSPDRANSLLPYVLIPQIILGGSIIQVSGGPLFWLAAVASPVYWGYRAIHLGASRLPSYIPGYIKHPDHLTLACFFLGLQTVVLLVATAWSLRQKDVRKA
ncbi:MAG TPA: ATP-binding cassette domain-containing protein [Gemmataceae bacterium]|jgi:ABC-type multidrug transport system ATPase subunit|nr:ATP-binding cassette domain-containing protein [Gemmataceae bacterium]